jgi:lipopolysaccharide transport system permease protein
MSSALSPIPHTAELELRGQMSVMQRQRWAAADIAAGLRLWRLALTLGWLDIRLRYRGSTLGPFWLTISTGVMVGALGVLYSSLFKIELAGYLPFLALGQVLWFFVAAIISEACTCFTENEGVIRSVRMPYFVFAVRTLTRNTIALAHNILVIVVVFAIFDTWPGWDAFMVVPGLLIWTVDSLALILLLGAFCARFRDIQPIVNSIMQIAFFLTPVIWKPEQLGPSAASLPWNPFFDLLEIVRGPILGTEVSMNTWIGTAAYSIALCSLAWAFFVYARGRVAFWI